MTTNERKSQVEQIDVAILGGGPAGLQAALVLSRTRKKIIVFDDPEPPRNTASHGVHNFLGLDGFLPADIRKIAWEQIDKYQSTEFRKEKIVNVSKEEGEDGIFVITSDNETSIKAKKVVLAIGYHDVYLDIPGFLECWADTIISCPFCDGYENRDRVWGIVANSKVQLERFPKMVQNWTSKIKVFVPPNLEIEPSYQNELSKLGIPVYRGIITNVNHTNTKVESVTLESGEKIEVETLLWIPSKRPSPLIQRLVENLGLELDEQGNVKTDPMQKTNVKGLYAAGDVKGSMGALVAANDGGIAGVSIAHEWYD
ncbi:MAG TPA: NAD(P)/FAD-dependent oxidoreductase [Nitrososphaera sp.]|nr:NAD(P)/FAD-dependent oxidoreductase [Nitrososphaera sp.]